MSQIPLFDFGVDIAQLKRTREVLLSASKAPNTELAYKRAWKSFTGWCHDSGCIPLPATEETLELYLTHLLEQPSPLRLQTIRSKLCGIQQRHVAAGYPSPFGKTARLMLSNAARVRQQRPNQKAAVTPGVLRAMIAFLAKDQRPKAARALKEKSVGKSALTPEQLRQICECRHASTDPMDIRDRSMFLIGFAAGWRGSEVMALDFSDVEFRDQGLVLRLGPSKTDQKAKAA